MTTQGLFSTGLALFMACALAGCGSSTPTSPSPNDGGGGGGGGTGTIAATITIGSNGVVSPKEVTVPVGSRVTFVNNDTRTHDMQSDPHPTHTDCPALAQVGFLSQGQSKTSGDLNTARVCGFHDHNQDTNTNLQGIIRVQ